LYVDDTDLLVSAKNHEEPISNIVQRAQKAVHIWRQGVIQTGGALRPEKCKWYLINFKWRNGKYKYCDVSDDPAKIFLKNTNGEKCEIDRLDTKCGLKGLRVHISPEGNHDDLLDFFISTTPGKEGKIAKWTNSINSSSLKQHDVYVSAFHSIFKSVEYVLPATSMSDAECKKIDTMLHKTFLPRIGIIRTMSIAYRSAPSRYQGLGSLHTSSRQFILKTKNFLQHANSETQLGKSITNTLESLHLLMGINTPLFDLSYDDYGFLAETTWITNLWQKSSEYGLKISGSYVKPNIIRTGDFSLMEELVQSGMMTPAEMLSVNRCRIYLRAQNFSDIVTGDGLRIRTAFMEKSTHQIRSSYTWPFQPNPPLADWRQWKTAVSEIWNVNEQGILVAPLGAIKTRPHSLQDWYYSKSTKKLYHNLSLSELHISYIPMTDSTRDNRKFCYPSVVSSKPLDAEPAIVSDEQQHRPVLESLVPNLVIDHKSDSYEKQLFYSCVNMFTQGETMAQVIREGNAIAVCDASVKNNTGAASWVITDVTETVQINGDHGVPPSFSTMDSYRAELYGIYSILQVLSDLEKDYGIQQGSIHIVCDNINALNNSFTYSDRAPITASDYDILWAIFHIRQRLYTNITFEHVYGHRDKTKKTLTQLERLNVMMDKRAGLLRQRLETQTDYTFSHLHNMQQWTVSHNGNIITRNLEKNMTNLLFERKMFKHLIEKKKYHPDAPSMINWDAIERASKLLPKSRQLWVTKFASGFLPTALAMQGRGDWDDTKCPICQNVTETTNHILSCSDERASNIYRNRLKRFETWMLSVNTDPILVLIIVSSLKPKYPTSFYDPQFHYQSPTLTKASQSQDVIGWYPFFKGHISRQWMVAQREHLMNIGDAQAVAKADKWASQLVSQIYDFPYSLWEYRNSVLHAKVDDKLNAKESQKLFKSITKELAKGTQNLSRNDLPLVAIPIEALLQKSVSERKSWLLSVRAARECVIKNKNNSNLRMRHGLLTWMRTGSLRNSSLPDG